MDAKRIKVIIADDHPLVRTGVRTLLELAGNIEVVAEAGDGEEAIGAAVDLQPDVVMMDLRMPGVGGVEATRTIVRKRPHVAVLVLTMVEDSESVFAALRAGARGYLLKEAGAVELRRAVHTVADGGFITSPAVAVWVTQFFTASPSGHQVAAFPALTHREREVLDLMAQGRNNAYIARRLVLSPKTVRNHISNIFAKLHATDRADAIVRAREAGLGQQGTDP
ncbi:response regulator [Streptomyces sp. NPDC059785]|uniref:response regulator n=1 Tax=unclassified Streptomyces TaxID=2593676 RepID=UPI003666DD02